MIPSLSALLQTKPYLLMGILNASPDSFVQQSRVLGLPPQAVLDRAMAMQEDGADILDLGAESSRPGSSYIDEVEELARLRPLVRLLVDKLRIPISIDTRKYEVARFALDEGVRIINDISAGEDAPRIFELVSAHKATMVLMHKQGNPQSMQRNPQYVDATAEVRDYLIERAEAAETASIPSIIIDPGLGFGKSYEHNVALIRGMQVFTRLRWPVLVGHSRKGLLAHLGLADTLGQRSGESSVGAGVQGFAQRPIEQRLLPGVGLSCDLVAKGVKILRVHDVKEHAQALSAFVDSHAILRPRGGILHA